MTEFQFGLLVGGFFGALFTYVILWGIQLHAADRQEKSARDRERTFQDVQARLKALSRPNQDPPHLSSPTHQEKSSEGKTAGETTVCYLTIHIE